MRSDMVSSSRSTAGTACSQALGTSPMKSKNTESRRWLLAMRWRSSRLGRPLVDLPDHLPARGVLALAAEHVRLDQLRAPLRDLVTECTCAPLERDGGRIRRVRIRERHHLEEVQLDCAGAAGVAGSRPRPAWRPAALRCLRHRESPSVEVLRRPNVSSHADDDRTRPAQPPAELMPCHNKVVRSDIAQQVDHPTVTRR